MLEFLGVVSTVLGIFKGMLMDLPFQLWIIIVLGSFTIYWVGREGVKSVGKREVADNALDGHKYVTINI